MTTGRRRRANAIGPAVIGALLAGLLVLTGPTLRPAAAGSGAAPTPTPERIGPPGSIASFGDSISTATGTHELGEEYPPNSWVTGTSASVVSMRERLGISSANAHLLASNGRRMRDFDDQAAVMPAGTDYAVLELGGNDACRPSVGEMTSVASYRTEFRNGLAALRAVDEDTLLFVASVPDIYSLWYLRGAPSSVNPHVADQTGQEDQARLYWDNGLIDVIPCKSLLDNPTSTSAGDEARRQQVRQRVKDFNQVLAEECAGDLRCRFDDNAVFDLSSNRVSPPDGPFLPRPQWSFEDNDISHNTGIWGWACPVAFTYNGCGDHFHPSVSGQFKLAEGAHLASFDFADVTPPVAGVDADRPPDGAGLYADDVSVSFTGSDAVGLRGQEVRVHHASGVVDEWMPSVGVASPLVIEETGTSWVEVRSIDVNGNQSRSQILAITIDPTRFGVVTGRVSGPDGPLESIQVGLHLPGTEGALEATTTGPDGSYTFDPVLTGDYKVGFLDPSGVHVTEWFDDSATHAAAATITVPDGTATADVGLALTPGSITGAVTNRRGAGLEGVTVRAVTPAGAQTGTDTTGPGGSYEIDGLSPGGYDVEFVGADCWAGEWFDDQPDRISADEVQVPAAGAAVVADARLAAEPAGPHGLSDVPAWLEDAVRWLIDDCNDPPFMSGFADGTFRDRVELSRGQAVRALYRIAGSPDVSGLPPHGLSGVGAWVEDPVRWAKGSGHMTGFADESFGSSQTITRAELVRVLYRLAGSADVSTLPAHGLSGVPAWVEDAVRWARAAGVLNGFADGTFRADLAVDRGQFANSVFNQNA